MTMTFTTIGSTKVEIEVSPAALPEACSGCTLRVTHWRGTPLEERTAYTFDPGRGKELATDITRERQPRALSPLRLRWNMRTSFDRWFRTCGRVWMWAVGWPPGSPSEKPLLIGRASVASSPIQQSQSIAAQ